jgi:hypothetical protein
MNLLRGLERYWYQSRLSEYYPELRLRWIEDSIEIFQDVELIGGARWNSGGTRFVEIWTKSADENKRQTIQIFLLQTLSALLANTTLILDGRTY